MDQECFEQGLLSYMPELWPDYQRYLKSKFFMEPTVHEIFGAVVGPFIKERVWDRTHQALMERIFDFIEDMAASSDAMMREVVCYGFLQTLDEEDWAGSYAYMGEATRRLGEQVEDFWRQLT